MLISNLQQFLRLLVPPLSAVGINQSAQKSVTGSLEAVVAALEPFKAMSTDQLAELVNVAREFRETGQIPEWVASKAPKPTKTRVAKAPKSPKLTPADAVSSLRNLHDRSVTLDPLQIREEVQKLSSMTVKELQEVQKEFMGVTIGKKKEELLDAIQKKIDDSRNSRERAEGIRTQ